MGQRELVLRAWHLTLGAFPPLCLPRKGSQPPAHYSCTLGPACSPLPLLLPKLLLPSALEGI